MLLRRSVAAAAIGLLVPLLVLARTAGAQDDDLARVRSAFDETTVLRIDSLIAAAADDGVPRVLLVEKAVEGAAKGHEPGVVFTALATLADELRNTVRLLGPDRDPRGLEKANETIRHGVDPEAVRRLAQRHPRDYPMLLQAIEDLLHAGVTLEVAQGTVLDASERGVESHDVLSLPGIVRRLVREGRSPVEAANSIRASLRAGRLTIPPPPPSLLGGSLRSGGPPISP